MRCRRLSARELPEAAHGVIASPHEAAALPQAAGRPTLTPGVRPTGATTNDQKRIATPAEAACVLADQIVVGLPIRADPDPGAAARAILADLPG